MREQHLADDVALNHELSRAVPETQVAPTFNQNHLFAMRIVKAGDLIFHQAKRLGLEIDPGGIKTRERARDRVDLELLIGVVAHQVGLHHRRSLVLGLHDQRHRLLKMELANVLDAGLDFFGLFLIDVATADKVVRASGGKQCGGYGAYQPPEPSRGYRYVRG